MNLSAKQIEAVLALPAPKRYDHFIKQAVGWRKIWGLFDDGWAMSEAADGTLVLPLWPAAEYADRCVSGEWASYKPREIELEEVLEAMIPMLRERGIQPAIFFSLEGGSINATLDELERDLRAEMTKYEQPQMPAVGNALARKFGAPFSDVTAPATTPKPQPVAPPDSMPLPMVIPSHTDRPRGDRIAS